jgi:hypothetical protein
MYDFTTSVLCRKKGKAEGKNTQQRLIARCTIFCTEQNLQLLEVKNEAELIYLPENALAYIRYPHDNEALWQKLTNCHKVKVTADVYMLGIAFTLPKLQRQHYCILATPFVLGVWR